MKVIIALTCALLAAPAFAEDETYRLIHAVENTERESARGLSKSECERRRDELKEVTKQLGVGGSVTCLPEWVFTD